MSVKSLFIYTLSLTLGIGAVTHAKSELIEQVHEGPAETEEFVHRSVRPSRAGFQLSRYEPRLWSYAPHHWSRWTV